MSQVENSAELEQKSGELAEEFGRVNYDICHFCDVETPKLPPISTVEARFKSDRRKVNLRAEIHAI